VYEGDLGDQPGGSTYPKRLKTRLKEDAPPLLYGWLAKLITEGTVGKVKNTRPVQCRAATITDRLL
jgi:hypothetical protein